LGPPRSGCPGSHSVHKNNIRNLKNVTIEWAHTEKQREVQELLDMKATLLSIYESEGGGYTLMDSK